MRNILLSAILMFGLLTIVFDGKALATGTMILVLDDSGSMADTVQIKNERGENVKKTRLEVVQRVLRNDFLPYISRDLKVGLISLNGTASADVAELESFVDSPKNTLTHRIKIMKAIKGASADGGTQIVSSLRKSVGLLLKENGEKIIVLVTDGEPNDSDSELRNFLSDELIYNKKNLGDSVKTNIRLYIVTVDVSKFNSTLKGFTNATNGEFFEANSSDSSLKDSMKSLLESVER